MDGLACGQKSRVSVRREGERREQRWTTGKANSMTSSGPSYHHQRDAPQAEASRFIQDIVLPAFADVAQELARYGLKVRTSRSDASATVVVRDRRPDEFRFTVEVPFHPDGRLATHDRRVLFTVRVI